MSGITKFYYHDMQGAPELKAEWGSLLNVIRTVAIDGFNPQTPLSIDIVDGECTVTFDELEPHGFIEHQVISLSGAIESEFDGEYRITSVNGNIITFNTSFIDGTITGDVTIKTSGMGWTEKYTGENKAVFTAKDTVKNPFYLRVDNSCPVGYDTTWGKFARVTISNGINDIDNYDGFEKAPTSPTNINTNENGNGVEGETGVFGWAKWYHGVETYQYLREKWYNQSPSVIPAILKWEIVGDDASMYLFLQITDVDGRATYAFTNIDSVSSIDVYNCFLSATDGLRASNQTGENQSTGRGSANCQWKSLDTSGKFILRPYNGGDTHISTGMFSLNIGNNQQVSGLSNDIGTFNTVDSSIITNNIYLKTINGIRGSLPIIKWVHNNWNFDRTFIVDSDYLYLILGVNYHNQGNVSKFVFDIKGF